MDNLSLCPQDSNPQKRCCTCKNFFPATPEYFPRQKSSKDGLKAVCKPCQLAYNHAYHASHRKEISEQRKEYYQKNAEHLRQYSAQWREENPEKVQEFLVKYKASGGIRRSKVRYRAAHRERIQQYQRQWHEEHREEQKEYNARYKTEHREERLQYYRMRHAQHRVRLREEQRKYRRTEHGRIKHLAHENNRRARKIAIGGTLTLEQIQTKLKAQQYKCYYCGAKFVRRDGKYAYHLEHTIPLSRLESHPRHDINYVVLACPPCNFKKNNRLPHEFFEGGRLF